MDWQDWTQLDKYSVVKRITDSASTSQAALEARLAAGQQPSLPYANMGFLLSANAVYVVVTFVLYQIMKNQEKKNAPKLKLKSVLLVYNLTCILAAGYCAVMILLHKFRYPGRFACNDMLRDEPNAHLPFVFWAFYAQKFWEFLDTWFFILRRSFRQVTFLHLFHHSSITFVVGCIVPYDYNGDMFLPILLNSIVHVLMYGHYFVTALGIKSWWSQYLTTMQLLQFMLISTQSYLAWSVGPSCGAPDWAKVLMILYMGSMLGLFGHFFFYKYVLRKPNQDICGVIKNVEPPTRQVYSGVTKLDGNGKADIALPPWFLPNQQPAGTNFSYQLTPIGAPMPSLHVSSEVDAATLKFSIAGGEPDCKVSWQMVCEVPPASTPELKGASLNNKKHN